MMSVFFVFLVSSVYTTDDEDFGNCKPLEEPVGSHPIHGGDIRTGFLSVIKEGSDIVARAFCNETQGFVPAAGSIPEMRCSWNEGYKEWTWNHFHRQRPAPAIRCARISPKPILQKYSLGPGFTGCDDEEGKQEFEGLFREYLSMLPCVEQEECLVTEVSCLQKKITVIVKPAFLHHIEKQKLIFESSVKFLKNFQPTSLHDIESHKRRKRNSPFDNIIPENTETSDCGAGEVVDGDNCKTCTAGFFANQETLVCEVCPLDEYSTEPVNECTACGTDTGTLNVGSTSEADCIGKGMLRVYTHDHFGGASMDIIQDTAFVGLDWDDKISSVDAISGNWRLFTDRGYEGESILVCSGIKNSAVDRNDAYSSMKLVSDNGCGGKGMLRVYTDNGFGGESMDIIQDTAFVGKDWNDKISSVDAISGNWRLFTHKRYEGESVLVCSGIKYSAVDRNDAYTSMKLVSDNGCGEPLTAAVKNIKIDPDYEGAEISYDAVDGASVYKIEYKTDGSTEWNEVTTTKLSHTLSNLDTATAYNLKVSSGNDDGYRDTVLPTEVDFETMNRVDGVWTKWTESSPCGTKTYSRTCLTPQAGGTTCKGEASKSETCADKKCPQNSLAVNIKSGISKNTVDCIEKDDMYCWVRWGIASVHGDLIDRKKVEICKFSNGETSSCETSKYRNGAFGRKFGRRRRISESGEYVAVVTFGGAVTISDPITLNISANPDKRPYKD